MNIAVNKKSIKKIVIVGGGLDAWFSATWLAQKCADDHISITVIAPPEPKLSKACAMGLAAMKHAHHDMGLNENTLLRQCLGSVSVGTHYQNWAFKGDNFFLPLGPIGFERKGVPFMSLWAKILQQGLSGDDGLGVLSDYSLGALAAQQGRFETSRSATFSPMSGLHYGYVLDQHLYSQTLKDMALKFGVELVSGVMTDISRRSTDGFIETINLANGEAISGDLFLDCTGDEALLFEKALNTKPVDYAAYLPNNRVWRLACASEGPLPLCTQVSAHAHGYRAKRPLQDRLTVSFSYSSAHMADQTALDDCLNTLKTDIVQAPELEQIHSGHLSHFWVKNCIAMGESAGVVDGLAPSRMALLLTSLEGLITYFPNTDFSPVEIGYFNNRLQTAYEKALDFNILHYVLTQRQDSAYWRDMSEMALPERLEAPLSLFKSSGRIAPELSGQFSPSNWFCLLSGLGVKPQAYDPRADRLSGGQLVANLKDMRAELVKFCEGLTPYDTYMTHNFKARSHDEPLETKAS